MRTPRAVCSVAAALLLALALPACDPSPTVPDGAPRTAAFWSLAYPEATTGHYHPSSSPYDSSDAALLGRQVRQMQSAGIQVGIVGWDGPGTHSEGTRLPAALAAAGGTNLRVTVAMQAEASGDPDAATIDASLTALATDAAAATWLRIDGRPVVFVPSGAADDCTSTARWASTAHAADWFVVRQLFPGSNTCADQPDDWYGADPSVHALDKAPYSYSVSPGAWDASDASPTLARDLARFRDDVTAMAASPARWHLVTSFNDHGAGTGIEPTVEYGQTYLTAMKDVLLPTTTTTSTTTTTTTTTLPPPAGPCGGSASHPPITHVVVFSEENKTWTGVGGTQFQGMPYLHGLAVQCRTYADWTEVDTGQNSASQYVGAMTGVKQAAGTDGNVLSDCSPNATTCRSLQDNLFRQVRAAGGTARNYVEGPTTGCSAAGNAAKHVPPMYFFGGTDQSYCTTEVRPLAELDPANLPTFAFVTPSLCNDMHDCGLATGDAWLQAHLQPVLDSPAYQAGTVLVEVWFDEDHPVPNLFLHPSVPAGVDTTTAATHFGALRLWEDLLGLPHLPGAATAVDLRPSLGLG